MAQPYVSGPVDIFVAPVSGNVLHLGTAEDAPDMDGDAQWEPVYNDIGGRKPIDYSWQREEATISMVLTRFNWTTVDLCMRRPIHSGNTFEKANNAADVGTLMIHEGFAYPLYLRFPYQSKAAYGTMPPGRRYLKAWLWGPEKIKPGTKAKKIHMIFKAISYLTQDGKWELYDKNLTDLSSFTSPVVV